MRKGLAVLPRFPPCSARLQDNTRCTILFATNFASYSGGEESFYQLIRRLDRSRYRSIALVPYEGVLSEKLRQAGIDVEVAYNNLDTIHPDAFQYFATLLQSNQARILHINVSAGIPLLVSALTLGIPIVTHVRTLYGRTAPDWHNCSQAVVAISDAAGTQRTIQTARALAPNLPILVRTQYVTEIDELYKLGADEVIPEEFEASVEVCNRVLRRVGIPGNLIVRELRDIREERYGMFRDPGPRPARISDLPEGILGANVETHTLLPGAWAVGRTLRELELRAVTGASVIALMQEGEVRSSPDPDRPLVERDTVILIGSLEQISLACHLLDQGPEGSPIHEQAPAGG